MTYKKHMKMFVASLIFIGLYSCNDSATKNTVENKHKKNSSSNNRIKKGLVALYQFKEGKGNIISDLSGVEPLTTLNITKNEKEEITWIPGGGIRTSPGEYRTDKSAMQAEVSSMGPATKINTLIKQTGNFTVEIWAKPSNVEQLGPIRLVSISENTGSRNLTIGHAAHAFDFRVRTSKTSNNGLPSLRTKDSYQAKVAPTHIVFTYSGSKGIVYINGKEVDWFFFEGEAPGEDLNGDLSAWDSNYQLILGNEIGGARAWKGDLYLVAFYNRILSKEEVNKNLEAKY